MKFLRPAPPPPPLLLPLLLSLIPVPSAGSPPLHSSLSLCETVSSCGNITNIAYPFYFHNDSAPPPSSYCGYDGFELTCRNNIPTLRLRAANYTVTAIDYSTHTISVADADFFRESPLDVCRRDLHNLTLDDNSTLGYAPSDANLTFFFECAGGGLAEHLISCARSGAEKQSYVLTSEAMEMNRSALPRDCRSVVVAPVLRDSVAAHLPDDLGANYKGVLKSGFQLSWPMVSSGDCGACENSDGRCGLNRTSNSTWVFACFCSDGIRAGPRCGGEHIGCRSCKIGVHVGVSAAVGALLVCAAIFLYLRRRENSFRDKANAAQNVQAIVNGYGAPKRYRYSELKKITGSFHVKLGEGGYGSVYKGTLKDGRLVAVKILKNTKKDGEEFMNEVSSIGRTSHVNIVSLLGFCVDGRRRALVYEYMSNGSLEKHIFAERPKENMSWNCLYKIAVGIARGLEYLHRWCSSRIVHFDIKPHNVLLDEDFRPKISDFGLAKLCPMKASVFSMGDARGTIGYIAPEVLSRNFGKVSTKSDVFSYGMVVLEMTAGRRNVDEQADRTSQVFFPHWVFEHLDQADEMRACDVTTETEEVARKMILVGLWCIQIFPEHRPSMSRVVEMLEGSATDIEMPPRPNFSS